MRASCLERFISALMGTLAVVYVGGMAIALLLFSRQYIMEHGFLDWLAFGEVVPSLKATIWPYYLIREIRDTDEVGPRLSDTRAGFHDHDIPKYYPILVEQVAEQGVLTVEWTSQDGNRESIDVGPGPSGSIQVCTSIPVSDSPDGSGLLRRLEVRMSDHDCDGSLDLIESYGAGQDDSSHPDQYPGAYELWDSCLAIVFMHGEPFIGG